MRVVMQQLDMDTCLTGLILGVSAADQIEVVRAGASQEDLADPAVLSIEAGGSGQVHLNNFDHHDTSLPLPPACRQALEATGRADPGLRRLVDYVAAIDAAGPQALGPAPGFPTLSDVFSGMRLSVKDPVEQLKAGLTIFATVLAEGLDAFGLMPERPEWQAYVEAKQKEDEGLARAKAAAEIFRARSGKKVAQGRRPELQGGGLRWSAGGWTGVAVLRRGREQWAADERILGSGPFVEQVLRETAPPTAPWPRTQALAALPGVVARCAAAWGVPLAEVCGESRRRPAAHVRAVVSALAVRHLSLSAAAVARALGVTPAVVLRGVRRGPQLLAARRLDPTQLLPPRKRKV